jgi:3,4-dihydroxy 2-butanone 4-phosphate synthase / GTP cyclohydrolase II
MSSLAAPPFATVEEALEELRAGRMVVICDDRNPAAGGDVVMAAEFATHEPLNFMATHARGLICLALTPARCAALGLRPQSVRGSSASASTVMVSIEAREGVSTGISTADRARTIAVAIDPATSGRDLVQPGHVFPVQTSPGGVLERPNTAEASVDLTRLAGLRPAAVKCDVLDDDGAMAQLPELVSYCARRRLKLVRIRDLVAFRLRYDRLVEPVASRPVLTRFGAVNAVAYRSAGEDEHHVAFVKGAVRDCRDVVLRVPAEGIARAIARNPIEPLELALETVVRGGRGVALCFFDREQGEGIAARIAGSDEEVALAALVGDAGAGRPPSARDYAAGAQTVIDLGVAGSRILTDDPATAFEMAAYLLLVNRQVSIRALGVPALGADGRVTAPVPIGSGALPGSGAPPRAAVG